MLSPRDAPPAELFVSFPNSEAYKLHEIALRDKPTETSALLRRKYCDRPPTHRAREKVRDTVSIKEEVIDRKRGKSRDKRGEAKPAKELNLCGVVTGVGVNDLRRSFVAGKGI